MFEPERVGDHEDAGHAHRGGRQHRIEKKPEEGIESARGNRNQGDVIGIGPEESVADRLESPDPAPLLSSFIGKICSGYGPDWTGLQTPSV